jgi:hypothetical protein
MAKPTGNQVQATSGKLASSTSILDGCFRVVFTHLRANMKDMFEKTDVAFQDFTEKAQSGTSQVRFMEAIGIIQRNREQVEKLFFQKLLGDFKKFGRPGQSDSISTMERDEPLALVSRDDEDIQVALLNMVESATLGSTHELFALRQRLAVLNNGQKLEAQQLPGGPACLARRFHEAACILDLEHETRLIVYMLFGKFVLGKLFPMYEEYNQHLVKAGVLPNLKYKVKKNPESPESKSADSQPAESRAATPAGNGPSLGDEVFGNIMQLLSRREIELRGDADSGAGSGPPVQHAEVVSAIHRLQVQGQPSIDDKITPERIVAGGVSEKEVMASLHARLSAVWDQLFAGIDRRRMPAADTQVIDLVGMMFEYLLNEENLPSVAKVELCRLHTPYLKVAIIDKNMFSDVGHPAHDLLNTLIAAGSRWVFEDNLDRGIFPTIRNIVQRIVDGFDKDLGIFTELLDLLKGKLHELEDTAASVETRTRQAAAGKEKLRQARTRSLAAIRSLVAGRRVPEDVRKLLDDVWPDKLMFIYLREPAADSSEAWDLAMQTIENIIWSVEPRLDDREMAELVERLPGVREQIEQAFEALDSYGRTDNEAQLRLIREYQEIALEPPGMYILPAAGRGDSVPATPQDDAAEIPAAQAGQEGEPHETVAAVEDAAASAPADEGRAADVGTGEVHAATGGGSPDAAAEPEQPVTGDHVEPHEESDTPEYRDALLLLKRVVPGTWFAFEKDDDKPVVRLKLSWHSDTSDEYMFVDGMGKEAAVMPRREFVSLIATGKTYIIRNQQPSFVQRAMVTIRRMLADEDELFDKSVLRE